MVLVQLSLVFNLFSILCMTCLLNKLLTHDGVLCLLRLFPFSLPLRYPNSIPNTHTPSAIRSRVDIKLTENVCAQ